MRRTKLTCTRARIDHVRAAADPHEFEAIRKFNESKSTSRVELSADYRARRETKLGLVSS